MRINTELALQSFTLELEVVNICQTDAEIHIKMFAQSKSVCIQNGTVYFPADPVRRYVFPWRF